MSKSSTTTPNDKITAVAIGGFDGIHRAHLELISRLGPQGQLLVIEKGQASLTPGKERCRHLMHLCRFLEFGRIKELDAEAFVELLQREYPALERIVVGYDFRFSKDRAADAMRLKELFAAEVLIVPEQRRHGLSIHSGTIRRLLRSGDLDRANDLLGYSYRIVGNRVRGQGLGAKALYPTLNLKIEHFLLPKEGVYATFTTLAGRTYPSVTFIGTRDSTDGAFAVETHLIDTELAPVDEGEEVVVYFEAFLREKRGFGSLEILKRQIEEDIGQARIILLSR